MLANDHSNKDLVHRYDLSLCPCKIYTNPDDNVLLWGPSNLVSMSACISIDKIWNWLWKCFFIYCRFCQRCWKFLESALHKAILNKMKVKIICCFFHLVKSMWKKCSKLGLKTKETLVSTKSLVDQIKILVHLPFEVREEYLERLQKEKA